MRHGMHKISIGIAFIVLLGFPLLTGVGLPRIWGADDKTVVVASSSWTGAIAEAAGADEVRVLAPFELKHPPEYDYRRAKLGRCCGLRRI